MRPPPLPLAWAALCLGLLSLWPGAAAAHRPGEAYLFLRAEERSLSLRVEATLADLDRVLGLDRDGDGAVDGAELASGRPAIEAYVRERVALGVGSADLPLHTVAQDVREHSFGRFARVHFAVDGLREVPDRVEAEYRLFFDEIPDHRGLLVVERNARTGVEDNESIPSLVFTPDAPRQTADLTRPLGTRGLLAFVRHGIWHIWIGIDHVLFVLLLVMTSVLHRNAGGAWVPASGFGTALLNVTKVVTLFTLAHTLTLSLAALGYVDLPPRLVESAIALSVVLVALDNVRPLFGGRTWLVVFGFGLFHGLGFASALGHLARGPGALAKTLVGFNLGVEVGQLAVIAVAFPLLFAVRGLRAYRQGLLPAASIAIGLVATMWLFERAARAQ